MYAIGLMSGTSLDGVDAALVEIHGCGNDTKLELMSFCTVDLKNELKSEIKASCEIETSNVELISSLNFKLGKLFSEAVTTVCQQIQFPIEKLDFVASHGQTIYHIPKRHGDVCASTLQIGEPAVIAYDHNVQVVSNFRVMDMAAGGEGAPLVPYSEYILYRKQDKSVALQNIGGISNVSVIPAGAGIQDVYAFDTGPGNMMIDEACRIFYQKEYDEDGAIGASGRIYQPLLDELLTHPYMKMEPPKSTGREMFGEFYVLDILERYAEVAKEDIIATFTYFTARCISDGFENFILSKHFVDELIVGGGGAHNHTLMRHLQDLLPNIKVCRQEDIGLSSDAKEAIAFVILANETLHDKTSNVMRATGAIEYVILGNITPAPRRK